jgi:superfamily I DNA/RNA helicase
MTSLSSEQQAIVELPLEPLCVTACAGSGKTRTATHRLWQMRKLLEDRHGIVALLSFSNVAVDTFRQDYYLLGRTRASSSRSSAVEIDTVDGFLTTNVIGPHAHRAMGRRERFFWFTDANLFSKGLQFSMATGRNQLLICVSA